mmetsp:Transcript_7420/g.27172  ORF Transcript_7420/g.27172 Transcript_7420/m.27172 type:complete len:292 (+) Transcript_7420:1612-2487(+)
MARLGPISSEAQVSCRPCCTHGHLGLPSFLSLWRTWRSSQGHRFGLRSRASDGSIVLRRRARPVGLAPVLGASVSRLADLRASRNTVWPARPLGSRFVRALLLGRIVGQQRSDLGHLHQQAVHSRTAPRAPGARGPRLLSRALPDPVLGTSHLVHALSADGCLGTVLRSTARAAGRPRRSVHRDASQGRGPLLWLRQCQRRDRPPRARGRGRGAADVRALHRAPPRASELHPLVSGSRQCGGAQGAAGGSVAQGWQVADARSWPAHAPRGGGGGAPERFEGLVGGRQQSFR